MCISLFSSVMCGDCYIQFVCGTVWEIEIIFSWYCEFCQSIFKALVSQFLARNFQSSLSCVKVIHHALLGVLPILLGILQFLFYIPKVSIALCVYFTCYFCVRVVTYRIPFQYSNLFSNIYYQYYVPRHHSFLFLPFFLLILLCHF